LVSLGEQMGNCNIDNEQVDLCRCLYKLHFQLMLILDSFTKLLRLVVQFCREVTALLQRVMNFMLLDNQFIREFLIAFP